MPTRTRSSELDCQVAASLGNRHSCQRHMNIFVLVRAVTYAALFIGLFLIYVPAQFLPPGSDLVRPATIGATQVVRMIIGAVGAVIAPLVRFYFRICRERNAGAIRSPAPARNARAVPVRAKSDVYRRRARSFRGGAFLRIVVDLDLCGRVPSRIASLRRGVRRADIATNVRLRIRRLLPTSQAVVAEGKKSDK